MTFSVKIGSVFAYLNMGICKSLRLIMNMLMIGDINPVYDGSDRRYGFAQVTSNTLKEQNQVFKGSGGISQENCNQGFCPAFLDLETGSIYLSRFADGRPAPMHMLDGLPQEVVTQRTAEGKVKAVKPSLAAGFVRQGQFYTRQQAATVMAGCVTQQDNMPSLHLTETSKDVGPSGSV